MSIRISQDFDTSMPCATGTVVIDLDNEVLAALEGWRAANLVQSRSEAARELVRIGLLSEIAKVQKLVEDIRASILTRGGDRGDSTC